MNASVGDRLVIRGHRIGTHERTATIVEVRGSDGGPPYLVRWDDPRGGEEEHLFFPGSDADIEHHPATPSG
jgi:hypothetical protein